VVGHGQHGLVGRDLFDPLEEIFEASGSVQEGELSVLVEVGEFAGGAIVGVVCRDRFGCHLEEHHNPLGKNTTSFPLLWLLTGT
jgi:hypothetical protein